MLQAKLVVSHSGWKLNKKSPETFKVSIDGRGEKSESKLVMKFSSKFVFPNVSVGKRAFKSKIDKNENLLSKS